MFKVDLLCCSILLVSSNELWGEKILSFFSLFFHKQSTLFEEHLCFFLLSWRGSPLSFFLQAVRQRDAFFIDSFVSICFFKFCKRVTRCRDTSKSLCPSNQPVPLPLISPLFLFAILKRLRLSRTRSQSLFFFCHVSKIKNDFRANSKIDLKK